MLEQTEVAYCLVAREAGRKGYSPLLVLWEEVKRVAVGNGGRVGSSSTQAGNRDDFSKVGGLVLFEKSDLATQFVIEMRSWSDPRAAIVASMLQKESAAAP